MARDNGVSLLLSALVHAFDGGDLEDHYDYEWPSWLIHQCAIGRWENGYLARDPRDERDAPRLQHEETQADLDARFAQRVVDAREARVKGER